MDANDVYDSGLKLLQETWDAATTGVQPDLPDEVRHAIAEVMTNKSQLSQRYALPGQLLLKLTLDLDSSRQLKEIEVDGSTISARTFVRDTLSSFPPVRLRLGGGDEIYVNHPLRTTVLEDDLVNGRGGPVWEQLFQVLAFVDANPAATAGALLETLRRITDWPEQTATKKASPLPKPKVNDVGSLQSQTGLDSDALLDILNVLESDQPQVILAGPPGTSKTHLAVALARFLVGDDDARYRVVQFHSSYGYEDFIEGLRPDIDDQQVLYFHVQPGVVRRIAEVVKPNERQVLILDEMNRANLPRVLGELLYAFERRGEPVDLLYTGGFKLPQEICFIGTMNTADRSIRNIDAAVRRRFQVFEMAPSTTTLEAFYEDKDNEIEDLSQGLTELNAALLEYLDRHHAIGHTFFMDNRGMTSGRLRQVWDRQVLPLIEEYLFDQPDLVTEFTLERFWPSMAGE